MAYVNGEAREQATLFPERIEDYVGRDNLFSKSIDTF